MQNELNPYRSPKTESALAQDGPDSSITVWDWFALPLPMLFTALAMSSSILVEQIGFLHLSLISTVPLMTGIGSGYYIARRVFRSKLARVFVEVFYCIATFATMRFCMLWVPIPFN